MWRKWQNCDILCQYESLKFYEFDTNIIDPNLTTVDRIRPQLTAAYKFKWKWKSEKLSISSKIAVLNQVLDQKWHLFAIVGSIWTTSKFSEMSQIYESSMSRIDGEIENFGKSIFEIRIPNFCYIQVIVFDLCYLPVAVVGT